MNKYLIAIIIISIPILCVFSDDELEKAREENKRKTIPELFDTGSILNEKGASCIERLKRWLPLHELKERPIEKVVAEAKKRLFNKPVNLYDHEFAINVLTSLKPEGFHDILFKVYPLMDPRCKEEIIRYFAKTHEPRFRDIAKTCLESHIKTKKRIPNKTIMGAWYFALNPDPTVIQVLKDLVLKIEDKTVWLKGTEYLYQSTSLRRGDVKYIFNRALDQCKALNPDRNPLFSFKVQDLDRLPYSKQKLTEEKLIGKLNRMNACEKSQADKIAIELLLQGLDILPVILKQLENGDLTETGRKRLEELPGLLYTVTTRRLIIFPRREDIHFSNTPLDIVNERLKSLYNYHGFKIDHESVRNRKDLNVSMELRNASLAETIAAICDKKGLRVYSNFSLLYDKSIWNRDGRHKEYMKVKGGLLYGIKVKKTLDLDMEENRYTLENRYISLISWMEDFVRFDFDEIVFADGSIFKNKFMPLVWHYDFNAGEYIHKLRKNKGKIKRISGKILIKLPLSYKVFTDNIQPEQYGKKQAESGHSFKFGILRKDRGKWGLTVEYGHTVIDDFLWEATGYIKVLNKKMEFISFNGGGSWGESRRDIVGRREERIFCEFDEKPWKILWVFPYLTEDYSFPVEFSDIKVPETVWGTEK